MKTRIFDIVLGTYAWTAEEPNFFSESPRTAWACAETACNYRNFHWPALPGSQKAILHAV